MATSVYKVIHGHKVPRGIGEQLHEPSTNYNLRGKKILKLPTVNTTTYGLKSRCYTAGKIWNALPDQFCAANKIRTFKNLRATSCKYRPKCGKAQNIKITLPLHTDRL